MSFARSSAAASGDVPPSRGRKGGNSSAVTAPSTPLVTAPSTSLSRIRQSPRIAQKSAARASSQQNALPLSHRLNGGKPIAPLPPFRPPALPPLPPTSNRKRASSTLQILDEGEETQDESQPLLSPEPPLRVVAQSTVVESQLTSSTGLDDFSIDDEDEVQNEADEGNNVFNVNDNDDFEDDSDGMHGFSSGNEFTVTERCSFYMDRALITSNNRQAVEFVYMIEAETLCRGENTMKLPELKEKIFNRYKALIRAIPATRFGEAGLREQMCIRISNSKTKDGSAGGHYKRTLDAKSVVQDVIRSIPNLSKLPSGRDIIDVRNSYILKKYKQEMGPVSFYLDAYFIETKILCYRYTWDRNSAQSTCVTRTLNMTCQMAGGCVTSRDPIKVRRARLDHASTCLLPLSTGITRMFARIQLMLVRAPHVRLFGRRQRRGEWKQST